LASSFNALLIINALSSMVKPVSPLLLGELLLTIAVNACKSKSCTVDVSLTFLRIREILCRSYLKLLWSCLLPDMNLESKVLLVMPTPHYFGINSPLLVLDT
jgi:hypothetical protein